MNLYELNKVYDTRITPFAEDYKCRSINIRPKARSLRARESLPSTERLHEISLTAQQEDHQSTTLQVLVSGYLASEWLSLHAVNSIRGFSEGINWISSGRAIYHYTGNTRIKNRKGKQFSGYKTSGARRKGAVRGLPLGTWVAPGSQSLHLAHGL